VDDLVGAREELAATGIELIGDLVWADELFDDPSMAGYGWYFFLRTVTTFASAKAQR
jgi:hypothetical protein